MDISELISALVLSDEPALQFKIRVHVLSEDPESKSLQDLQQQTPQSKVFFQCF